MTETIWAAGTIITVCLVLAGVVFAWNRALQLKLDHEVEKSRDRHNILEKRLPIDYMPRAQVENQLAQTQNTLHAHMTGMETRSIDRFDKIDSRLELIFQELKGKADKRDGNQK